MKKTMIVFCAIVFSSIFVVADEPVTKSKDMIKQTFFDKCSNEIQRSVTPYSKIPGNETSLAINQHGNVVISFVWWAKRIIRPEYLPSDEYMKQNLQLYPASKEHEEDVAILPFTISGRNFRLVQTGGLNSRLYLFAEMEADLGANESEAKIGLEQFMGETILREKAKSTASLSVIATNDAYLATGNFDGVSVKCLAHRKEVCVSIPKTPFEDTLAAHEPMPNEWFLWEQAKKQKRLSK